MAHTKDRAEIRPIRNGIGSSLEDRDIRKNPMTDQDMTNMRQMTTIMKGVLDPRTINQEKTIVLKIEDRDMKTMTERKKIAIEIEDMILAPKGVIILKNLLISLGNKEKKDILMIIIRRTEESILQNLDQELEVDLVKDQEIEMIDLGKEEIVPEMKEPQAQEPEIYLKRDKEIELEIYLVIDLELYPEIHLGTDRTGSIEILAQKAVEWAEEIPTEEGAPVPDIDLLETEM